MKDLALDRIAAFDAVMETGSLSGAARRLRLSQPTIRAQIAGLEDDLGQVLFTRTTAGLVPTDRARDLADRARAVRQAALAFGRAASGDGGDGGPPGGRVRITASRVFAAEVLPGVLAPLLAEAPGLRVEIAATDAVEDLGAQDADIAIRLTEPRQAALVARRLRPVTIGVHASADLIARFGLPGDAADLLTRLPVVTEDRGRTIAEALAARGLPPPALVALAADDDLVQLAAIAAGVGYGFCQAGVGAARGLTRVLPDFAADLPVWAVIHEDLRRQARVRAVFDHLTGALA